MRKLTKTYLRELTQEIIGAAIEVHKELGAGLLESLYEDFMAEELKLRGLKFERQKQVEVVYKRKVLDTKLRYDLLVEDAIVVELKAVKEMDPIFTAIAMTYAKLLKKPKVILINFTCENIWKEGQQTFVNDYFKELDD